MAQGITEITDVLSVFNGERLSWMISDSDPDMFTFPEGSLFRGWSVLSPLILPESLGPLPGVVSMEGERLLVLTENLSLMVSADSDRDRLEEAQEIVAWLHLATGHAELSVSIIGGHHVHRATKGQVHRGTFTGRDINDVEENAITFDRIAMAAGSRPACDVPTYTEILHDAIEALAVADFRKAILYSAMAVEEMGRARIEEAFDVESVKTPERFHLIERHARGGTVRTDPVFVSLKQSARRDFPALLDGLSLYVFGQSMFDKQNALYNELLKVRDARNGLAHGSGRAAKDSLPIDDVGAHRAVHAAIDAFRWFGAPGRYLAGYHATWRRRKLASRRMRDRGF